MLGIESDLDCPLPEAVSEFDRLDSAHTPLEKLMVLNDAISLVTYAVQRHTPGATVTSDELIPLLCSLLVQAKVPELHSLLEYLEAFLPRGAAMNEQGYALVSFKAALSVVTSPEMSKALTEFAVRSPELTSGRKGKPAFGRSMTGVALQSLAGASAAAAKPKIGRAMSSSATSRRSVSSSAGAAPPLRWGAQNAAPPTVIGDEVDMSTMGDFLTNLSMSGNASSSRNRARTSSNT